MRTKMISKATCVVLFGLISICFISCSGGGGGGSAVNNNSPVGGDKAASLNYALPTAILDYTNASSAQMTWMNQRFSLKISGDNPNNHAMSWMFYRDMFGVADLTQYMDMKDFAEANGYDYTQMVLHAKIDFTSTVYQAWSQMDKFDNFEGVNGILLEPSTGTYTDRTNYAYNGGYTTAINSNLYIGYEEPFDRATFTFSTPAVGLSGSWQYWNGSLWTALTVVDGTSNMTTNGTIVFVPPSSWSRVSINSSRTKYFIRFAYTSATTSPVFSTIKGDNWLRGSGTACRGWSSTGAINSGALTYNPNPPAGSSARFPYQAMIGTWGPNHAAYNPAYKRSGKRAAMDYLAHAIQTQAKVGYTGVMMDQADALPSLIGTGIDLANTDFPDYSSNTEAQESIERFAELTGNLHTIISTSFKVGLNTQNKAIVSNALTPADWNLAEYHTSVWQTLNPPRIAVGDWGTDMSYDDYLPANNPNNKFGMLIYRDYADNGHVTGRPGVPWDMANRGPITALSKHLIAYNSNTYFAYHTNPSFAVYSETDQVVLNDNSVVHLSTAPVPALSSVKRWATWFPAMAVDFGTPSSPRDLAWKLGANIGGGQNVWRRDWSNAVVLHRPAAYDTTDNQYNTYSSSIDLGGTFYPLYADGTVGTGITSISLRHGEGAILMRTR